MQTDPMSHYWAGAEYVSPILRAMQVSCPRAKSLLPTPGLINFPSSKSPLSWGTRVNLEPILNLRCNIERSLGPTELATARAWMEPGSDYKEG